VTIVPPAGARVTYQRPDSDRYNYPEAYLRARIVGMLGGRAAEEIVYGTKTDRRRKRYRQATGLARRMSTRWGYERSASVWCNSRPGEPYLSGPNGYAGEAVQREDR